ncbi:MAG: tetraacyldisaccharide 4'-kinase [Woeseiaceae bacterium]|nr:tetraacyldisaccharide 4'-kinase [Woeseiaceae bacterium]
MSATYRWIHRVWYDGAASGWVLLPLSGLYWLLLSLRSLLFRCGLFRTCKAHAPVIVVGNITAGGTGKTPTVIWLVNELRAKGYTPGIVSRGYGGSKSGTSMRVDIDSDAAVVGDEPVLLARRARCPVAVDSDRVRAAAMLVDDGVDVIIADDGLQHLRLQRDFEICVVDGERGLGNRRLLPAGPLREAPERLQSVDQVLVNGTTELPGAIAFELVAREATRLNGSLARPLQGFKDTTVHAVAGIGNPKRFFDLLRTHGIQVIEHSFPDHAALSKADLQFGDDFNVFMTEKDAVKVGRDLPDQYWYVPVDLTMDAVRSAALIEQIDLCLQRCGDSP